MDYDNLIRDQPEAPPLPHHKIEDLFTGIIHYILHLDL